MPTDSVPHRCLHLADNKRQPVDIKHQVKITVSCSGKLNLLTHHKVIVFGSVEINQMNRDVFSVLAKRHGNPTKHPVLEDLISPDESTVSRLQQHPAQAVDNLIRQISICAQRLVQFAKRIFKPSIDKYILRLFTIQPQIFTMDIVPF